MKSIPRRPITKRVIGPRPIQQIINGISMDLDALPAQPDVEDIRSIIGRLMAVCERIEAEAK